MEKVQTWDRNLATIGLGALLIWWGVVLLVDPLTIGIGAIGTGLILLGINLARLLKGVPTKGSTTVVGTIALVWGALDQALALHLWPSLATMLIVIGVVVLVGELLRVRQIGFGAWR